MGELLSCIVKAEEGGVDLNFVDAEVFGIGLTRWWWYWDTKLCFEKNDLGEMKATAKDPFAIYIDPDAYSYDLCGTAAYIQESVWTDLDSINEEFVHSCGTGCLSPVSSSLKPSMILVIMYCVSSNLTLLAWKSMKSL